MYFDETYNEKHYKADTVKNLISKMDILVCIGTMLETSLAASIVNSAIQSSIPIIEVNVNCIIEKGNCFKLSGKSE